MGRASLAFLISVFLIRAGMCQCGPGSGPGGNQLARAVVENELRAEDADQARWMYQLRKKHGDTTELSEVVETKQGPLSRRIAANGGALSAEEQKKEDERIQKLLQDPEKEKKAQQERREDSEQARKLLQMLPEAFNFTCGGAEGKLIKLNFRPNPQFHPSSRQAHVFHDMVGSILVEPRQKRLAGIEGHLLNEVKFGGGLLGHLDKGGDFFVTQTEVAPNHWEMTRMRVNMHGKALFFKTISVQEDETRTNYHQVPGNLTLSQAAQILRKELLAQKK